MDKDKNKNRTDLLAAGRKKLQQYRQKKDGKGSKSSGKAAKSEHDADADAASAAKLAGTLLQVPDADISSVHNHYAGFVDMPVTSSHGQSQSNDGDIADVDPLSVGIMPEASSVPTVADVDPLSVGIMPEAGSVPTELERSVELMPEDLGGKEAAVKEQYFESSRTYQADSTQTLSADSAMLTSGYSGGLVSEMNSVYLASTILVDSFTPPDLVGATQLVGLAVEADAEHVCGADQVTDGADCLVSKQVDTTSGIDLEGLLGLGESGESCAGSSYEDTSFKEPTMGVEQTKLNGISAAAGEPNEVKVVCQMDWNSVSPLPLRVSYDSSAATPEVAMHQRKDAVATFLNDGRSKMWSAEGNDTNLREEVVNVEAFLVAEAILERPIEDKIVSVSSGTSALSMSVSQLAQLLRRLDEEEFKLVLASRELTADSEFRSTDSSATNGELRSNIQFIVPEYQSSDVLEEVTEQLYLANVEKDVFLLQLDEQSVQHLELSQQHKQLLDEMSIAEGLITKLRERNESLAEEHVKCKSEFQVAFCATEELERQYHSAKAEVVGISTRADELHLELERSHVELSSLSADLADCRVLASALQIENDNLNENLTSAVEEKKRLKEEKGHLALSIEELLKELAECKGSLVSLQEENVYLSGSLALTSEERRKLKEEKENVVHENKELLTNLTECKALLEALQVDNANLNGSLTSVMEERSRLGEEKDHFVTENEKLLSELVDCRSLIAGLQLEYHQAVDDMKYETLCPEQLEQEKMLSSKSMDASNQIEVNGMPSRGPDCATTADETHQLPREWKTESFSPRLRKNLGNGSIDWSQVEQLKLEAWDHCSGFVGLKAQLEEAENVTAELENAVEGLHSHSLSLSNSSDKMVAPAVSRLIQAFESKAQLDDHDIKEVPPAADESLANSCIFVKEQTRKLRAVLKKLHGDAKKASKLYMGERDCRIIADAALGEPTVTYEALEEHINLFEAANIELAVLYEFLKHHLYGIEAKRVEHLALCQALKEQSTISVAKNIDLVKKLGDYQLRISELEKKLDKMHSSSDEMASSMSNQAEFMHKEVAERGSMLEEEWNSTVAQIVQMLGKLDLLVGSSYTTTLLTSYPDGMSDTGTLVASSVEAAMTVIEDLWGKLEASRKDYEAMSSSHKNLYEKLNDLQQKHELAIGVLLRVSSNLKKLVDDSCIHIEQSQIFVQNENVLDPLYFNNCDTLIERVALFLGERLQLETMNDQLNSELINKAKEIEEMKGRGLDSDGILKLVEDVEGAIMLEGTGLKSHNLASRLQYLISFLFHRYKEADNMVTTRANSREEKELSGLQGEINHLTWLIMQHETENIILKEFFRLGVEDLIASRSDLQEKVNELEQSEQRVASIKEKLGIAVSKGKGLIVQRDSLKKSLAETSNELDKCLQELQLKDTRLQEVETELKMYSEAGERVEALESELSYIRNSATALRESFLLKDSVLQRIEEILDDLQLPEHVHSRDIIERVDWLAQSITRNTFGLMDWDQKSSVGGGSYSDTGFVAMDVWKEDSQLNLSSGDDLQRKYEELQSKFYGLAEQNEMLEQLLMEKNNVLQRWEEIMEGIAMPLHLRSMEPENRIEWLKSALSESDHQCNALQVKVHNFETYCATLTADLEESQKRLSELETALQAVIDEKEHLSGSLEILTRDSDKVSEKLVQLRVENDKLHMELTSLKYILAENSRNQKHIEHIDGDIRRLVKLVTDVIQDSDIDDAVFGGSSTECLEWVLQKLFEKYTNLSLEKHIIVESDHETKTEKDASIQFEKIDSEGLKEQDLSILKQDLDEALHGLMCLKEERESHMEQNQSLINEVEALNLRQQEMQDLLSQEEQKSASVREKLNVAVRKGKSLVQQRDSLKQTIEEVNDEVKRLKSEINHRDSSLSDYEQKIKVLSSLQENVQVLESDNLSLRNRLAETEYLLLEKTDTLGLILNTLKHIGAGFEFNISYPVESLEQIGRQWHDLHVAVAASEQDMMKSKRAAELLLAELNEVQERNDGFQEELAKYSGELLELSTERDLAEVAKREAFSQVEKLSAIRSEEGNNQFAELMILKSNVDQLRKGLFETNDLLGRVLSKEAEYVQNLEASLMSCLEPSEALNVVHDSIISLNKENQETFSVMDSMLHSKMQEDSNETNLVKITSLTGHHLQGLAKGIDALNRKLYKHSVTLDEGVKHVIEVAGIVHREVTSRKMYYDSMKETIIGLERTEKEKDVEIGLLCANITLLYEACCSSVIEIENWKADFNSNGLAATDHGLNSGTSVHVDIGNMLSQLTLLSSDQRFSIIADRLLLVVKDFIGTQAKVVEASYKEMKTTISNLQMELQEKDLQKDRICMELVSQIKEAEAAAGSHLQDFQSANKRLNDLERQLEAVAEQRNILEQKVKELQDGEANSKDLAERVQSLNDVLTAKEQEIESLMQALDEEEIQMEEQTNKIGELERVLEQKNLDLENLEASRGKVMKKLSITVSKFDELHHLSGSLLSEVEKLQLQLQERDLEISFLRQEVARCTNDALVASQMSSKRNSDEIYDLLTWLDSMTSGVLVHDVHFDEEKLDEVHHYKERFRKHIILLVSEIEDLKAVAQNRDMLLQVERDRVRDLTRKGESLEDSLREAESQLTRLQNVGDCVQTASMATEILEVEPEINKWAAAGASITPQVRSLRKVNSDQVAIGIDMESGSGGKLEDEDDDKAHGFRSLTTSRIVPRFARPVTDMIDGLWVSCDRMLMRQPALRLGVIMYWAFLHALLTTFVI